MPYPNSSENPYAVQYPNKSESLLKFSPEQIQQFYDEYGAPVVDWGKDQIVQKGLANFAPFLPAFGSIPAIKYSINNSPYLQNKIALFGATRFGAPIVNGVKKFANNPTVQKVDRFFSRIGEKLF